MSGLFVVTGAGDAYNRLLRKLTSKEFRKHGKALSNVQI